MILPGAVIGVLGGGQLGRMFAIAARRMGYRVHTLSPDADTPTGQVADVEIIAPYEDLDAVRKFSAAVSVVTFEFENVPSATAEAAEGLSTWADSLKPEGRPNYDSARWVNRAAQRALVLHFKQKLAAETLADVRAQVRAAERQLAASKPTP